MWVPGPICAHDHFQSNLFINMHFLTSQSCLYNTRNPTCKKIHGSAWSLVWYFFTISATNLIQHLALIFGSSSISVIELNSRKYFALPQCWSTGSHYDWILNDSVYDSVFASIERIFFVTRRGIISGLEK